MLDQYRLNAEFARRREEAAVKVADKERWRRLAQEWEELVRALEDGRKVVGAAKGPARRP